jgi:hypothetical protein
MLLGTRDKRFEVRMVQPDWLRPPQAGIGNN